MKRQKRVWDKKAGGLIYVHSVKDFLAQQSEDKVEAPVEKEEEIVEEEEEKEVVEEEADEASD